MKKTVFFFLIFLFVISCNQRNKQHINTHTIRVVEAHGYVVPKDSMRPPNVVMVDEKKLKKVLAGKPKVTLTNLNIHPAGIPKRVLAGKPRICTPGQDTFLLPKTVPAIDSPFVAGIPEIVIAKDADNKDQNSQNFSTYGKIQGLRHNEINCFLEDKTGNIWFGTNGGVTKFDGRAFTHFSENEGLSNNNVYSILEDKTGNLWFGTYGGGVTKYDGKSFTRYSEKEGLSNNVVWSMREDRAGNLWFGTDGGGLSKYNGRTFTHFTEKQGLINNVVWSIHEDKYGNLWLATHGGLVKFDGNSFTQYTVEEGLNHNSILCLFEDSTGNLWFGSQGGGASKFDGRYFVHFTEKEGLSNNVVFSILEDKSGSIWFGTYGGGASKLVMTEPEDPSKYAFTHFTIREGLNSNYVSKVFMDKFGQLWFGTDAGVSKFNGNFFRHFTEKEGLSTNQTICISKDHSGVMWFGLWEDGVIKFDGNSFSQWTKNEGLNNNIVSNIIEDKSGNLWISTLQSGICKFDRKSFTYFKVQDGLCNNDIRSVLEDKSGNLWFGTWGGGVSKYDGKSFTNFSVKEGLSNDIILSMLEDKAGKIWFGTKGGGISVYDGKGFTHFKINNGLINNEVSSILEDNFGNLWFGTLGGGVSKYDGKHFNHFTEKEGLCNNFVLSIIEDISGNIWFGTRFGLSRMSLSKMKEFSDNNVLHGIKEQVGFFRNYTYEDGFLGIGCAKNAICKDEKGTIWIGANDRLTAMYSKNMLLDTIAPSIRLTKIALFNEDIAWQNLEDKQDSTLLLGNGVSVSDYHFDAISKWYGLPEHLSLAYNNNYLTFNFIGITMNQPKNVKYRYKLEGLDDDWSALTSRNDAAYGNIPHGTFTFKVKAMNSEGYLSEPEVYTFTIRPPWWLTWWFKTLVVLMVVGSVVFYIKWRERKLKEKQKELELKINEATFEIKEQKNLIEEKHQEIKDSINYAERIQRSFLATTELLNENLKEYFVFFQPKDVVSGDFYWAAKLGNGDFALMTADSTGHGVPGAIMSILNITCVEKAVEEEKLLQPNKILNHTRENIVKRLQRDGSEHGGKDGMDAILICFDFKKSQLSYAAAHNPLWIVRKGQLLEFEPDKMPVGKHEKDSVSFTQHTITLHKGDVVYSFTDGMADQFGGPRGKKFMYKQLKELLVSVAEKPMADQKKALMNALNNWKGDLEQVDDVCIIGVRV